MLEHQDEQFSELVDLAESIVLECKESKPLSTLNTAIFLFEQVLKQQPSHHRHQYTHFCLLAEARLTRYIQTGWVADFDEAVDLFMTVADLWESMVG